MAYSGKTDWQNNQIVNHTDMNRIEQGITDTSLIADSAHNKLTSGKAVLYAAATGVDNYKITLNPPPNISAGLRINFLAQNENSVEAVTLSINDGAAIPIYRNSTTPILIRSIKAGQIVSVVHDGNGFQLLSGSGSGDGITKANEAPINPINQELWLDTSEDNYQASVFADMSSRIGDVSALTTEDKSSLVGAVNETVDNLNLVQSDIDSHEALKSPHGVAPVELWSGVETVNDTNIPLSEAITNFHFVVVVGQYSGYNYQALSPLILPTAMIEFGSTNNMQMIVSYTTESPAIHVRFSDSTHLYAISGLRTGVRIRKVYGLLRK